MDLKQNKIATVQLVNSKKYIIDNNRAFVAIISFFETTYIKINMHAYLSTKRIEPFYLDKQKVRCTQNT